jgi:hypothetical protein
MSDEKLVDRSAKPSMSPHGDDCGIAGRHTGLREIKCDWGPANEIRPPSTAGG